MSYQYIVFTSRWLHYVCIGNICLVLSCHTRLFGQAYWDSGILHLSCHYDVLTSKWLFDVGIGNICCVLSCHTSLFWQDILRQWNTTLVMINMSFLILNGYMMWVLETWFVLSCHTSLFWQDILGPRNTALVMSLCHSLTSKGLYDVGIGNICFVLSCHTSLFWQDLLR